VAALTGLIVLAMRRFASQHLRRAPAWDCGFPDANPAIQYSSVSFAQPIRRIFGSVVFAARERIDMPAPGDPRPATMEITLRDPAWDGIFAPTARLVWDFAGRINVAQFLTIRRYLSLMFAALVILLLLVAVSQ
jgi:hydrogenase-4 component B